MGSQIWHFWERAPKRNSGLCEHFSVGESCPPAHALMLDSSFPPCMPLMSFNLLPPHWSSKGMSLSRSMHGPCKRNCWDSSSHCPPQPQSPLVFEARSYEYLIFWHWNPGLGPGVRYPSLFYLPHVAVEPSHSVSAPPISLDVVSSLIL